MGVPSNFVTPTGWMASGQGNFVPDIFSKKLQLKFYAQTILDQISNTDYEGEISGQGSKVIIRTVPSVTVSDYAGSVSYSDVTTSTLELVIDKAKSFAFKVDDVLKSMSDVSFWDEASKDASNQMRISVETDFQHRDWRGGRQHRGPGDGPDLGHHPGFDPRRSSPARRSEHPGR